ncbi:MAG: pectate lyase [Pirellulales bacterium]|nr:pectate lyase [Pirellulales bacterium]
MKRHVAPWIFLALLLATSRLHAADTIAWKACLSQSPMWYGSAEAIRIADNVLAYQRACGGWPKNLDMAAPLDDATRAELRATRDERGTIDNGATYTQLRYLARVAKATGEARFREGVLSGIDFLLAAQYPSGGWPQVSPNPAGYSRNITFNDNAMTGALQLLRDVSLGEANFDWIDDERRIDAGKAVERGIECILQCQIVVDGRPTVWCAQHDPASFAPAGARSYELPSFSGSESVGIVRFLMQIDEPGPAIVASIEGAVDWFERAKLTGLRIDRREDPSLPRGWDKIVVEDPQGPPIWARFYDLKTNRPFFCSRDGVPREHLAEIEYERRTGYAWYGDSPAALLSRDYPRWQARWNQRP